MRFSEPVWLWLLWLLPALATLYLVSFRGARARLRRFASEVMLERLTARVSHARQLFKAVLVVSAVALCVLALAGLEYGFTWEEVQRRGVDVVIALDVSDSMLVRDADSGGGLSRLERARREIQDLLRLMEGDRVALVAFAGDAYLELPLTLDYAAAELFLDHLEPGLIQVKGTALAEALRISLEAFEGGAQESKAILLITDGEDHEGDVLQVAEQAAAEGVRIFAIGIGRVEGAPIPQPRGGFLRDRSGEIVLSRLDEATLQRIALGTGGRYVRSVTGDVDLEEIYLEGIKTTLEEREFETRRRRRWHDRFQWLLAGALLLLMVEPLIREQRRRPGARRRASADGTDGEEESSRAA